MDSVSGCHMVGSVPLDCAETVFCQCIAGLPDRLKRVPDGETDDRSYFVYFQRFRFPPIMVTNFTDNKLPKPNVFTVSQIQAGIDCLKRDGLQTGYDKAAIESYAKFRDLRSKGLIRNDTNDTNDIKFQVSLPTMANVVGMLIEPAFQPQVAPIYEEALMQSLRKIQDSIPHEDLAIQIDLGMDLSYWEDLVFKPWFDDKGAVVQYIMFMIGHVDADVDLGLHYCYGDMEHKHFAEPASLRGVVDLHLQITHESQRPIQWMHCPVPKSAMDKLESYLNPLSELQLSHTELYLGLVHPGDLLGTWQRIEAASKVVGRFGVSSECGLGRATVSEFQNIVSIMKTVSEKVQLPVDPRGPA